MIDGSSDCRRGGFLRNLARDTGGNTIMLVAAALLPLIAMIGGGVDISRGYLAESRLQQACDAGVLAARKELGSDVVVTGDVPGSVVTVGQSFFDLNFRDGIYGTTSDSFQMTLEDNYAISGTASADLPTTLMGIFGYDNMPIAVACQAQLNFTNMDLMMVLDVTGSMRHTNAGDSQSRLDSLRFVVRNFHAQIDGSKSPGTRVRYGFVPYSTNVNIGHLLQDDWVVDEWTYQSRTDAGTKPAPPGSKYTRNWKFVSGTRTGWVTSTSYPATWNEPASSDQQGYYSCNQPLPAGSWVTSTAPTGKTWQEQRSDPPAVLYITEFHKTHNGTRWRAIVTGTTCEVQSSTDTNYVQSYEEVEPIPEVIRQWRYQPVTRDVSNWRAETGGCMEERGSTFISDYSAVDLADNPDLDINLVPTPTDSATQWRPRYPGMIYARAFDWWSNGSWSVKPVVTTDQYLDTGNVWWSACPAPARNLAEMSATDIDSYLATLSPVGATYHDVGMLWGARLISPNGLFAEENADEPGRPTSRHLIFLTDGQTEPYDLSYSAYGVEPLDQRRWTTGASMSLKQTVNERFLFACKEAKKQNVTVWVIAFGTSVNSYMTECAGPGRYFEARNSAELSNVFTDIAKTLGDLRISN